MIKKPNKGDRWSREEMILVFNLYFKLTYGQMDHRNPQVQELANIMGRSSNSVAMRLNNFAACDPMLKARGISGLSSNTKSSQLYWNEFFHNQEALIFESEKILAEYQETTIEKKFKNSLLDIPRELTGKTKIREVKIRVNQNFFRQIVLANYDGKCALTGIDIKELLIASHIIPWADDEKERLNPENGICLSALYDKAFDKGLITFDDNETVVFSKMLKENIDKDYYGKYFEPIENAHILTPKKISPKS